MPDAVTLGWMQALDSGACIVTANPRLALWLRRLHDATRLARGETAWTAAAITPIGDWMAQQWQARLLWDDAPPAETLLTGDQEQYLWEQLLAGRAARAQLDIPPIAAAALRAWHGLHAWRIDLGDLDAPEWHDSPDSLEFRDWAIEYRKRCSSQGWLSPARLPDAVQPRAQPHANEPRLLIAGFEEPTPQQRELFERFRAVALDLEGVVLSQPEASAYSSPEAEMRAAARWARQCVEGGAANVAVVVPDLSACRTLTERAFIEELHPGRPAWDAAPRAFEISLGPALDECPLVVAAFDLLELAAAPHALEWTTVSRLLRSPWLPGGEAGRTSRARLELRLREQGMTRLTLRQLAARAECRAGGFEPLLRGLPPRQAAGAAAWAAAIGGLLAACGWTEGVALDSAEYQAREAWQALLDEYAALEMVATRESFPMALARLRRMAAARVFQPRTTPAPIQVLGWLEAAGMSFDAIWMASLDDVSVPAPPRPNPFLPWRLQYQLQMPRSSAGRERHFAQRRYDSLLRSARRLNWGNRVSYSATDAAGNPRLPSPLAPALHGREPEAADAAHEGSCELESFDDAVAPALPLPRPEGEHHGSRLFEDQYACPFRAFAHRRLGAAAAPAAGWGLTSWQRGRLVHAALEIAWQRIQTSQRLHELMAEGALPAAIEAAARAAVETEKALDAWPWLREPETQRLQRMLGEWFEIDLSRPEPFHVETREERREVAVAGLPLRLVTDRVDLLADGERVIVDYKSGRQQEPNWDDAAAQPQLPLYAVTAPDRIAGVAIAVLSDDPAEEHSPQYFARTAREGIFAQADATPGFDDALQGWRTALESLAREYLAGAAAILPRHGLKTCQFCDLKPLCRIHDRLAETEGFADGMRDESDD